MRKLSLLVLLIVSMILTSMPVITVQAAGIQLKVYTRDEGYHENNIEKPRICIENTGTVEVSNFIMYYYFTVENNKVPVLERYYQTDPSITTLEEIGSGKYRVKINPRITLAPGARNEGFVFGLHYGDWSPWDKTNDFSYISTSTYALNPHVLVVDSAGNVIYGEGMPLETTVNVTSSSTTGVTGFIDVHPSTVIRNEVDNELFTFCTSPQVSGMGGTITWNYPSLKSFYVVMPKGATLNISYPSSSARVTPNYRSILEGKFGTAITINPSYYSNRNYPENLFEQEFTANVAGVSLALIKVSPIQYNPLTDELTEYDRINFQFSFTGGSGFVMPDGTYRDVINNSVINPQISTVPGTFAQRERGDILIIANNQFTDAVNRFALWKRQMGFDVTIEARNSWPSADVEAFIASRNSNPPDYVILFGDHPYVESKVQYNYTPSGSSHYYSDSPYFFSESLGSDGLPKSATARIPVDTLEEAYNAVDKIIAREKQPPSAPSYYNNIWTSSYFQDDSDTNFIDESYVDGYEDMPYTRTAWEIGQYLTTSQGRHVDRLFKKTLDCTPSYWNKTTFHRGEALPTDLLEPGFNWWPTGADHVSAFNSGRMLGIYRGHGDPGGTYSNFSTADVSSLNNSSVLPVLFLICCSSGEIYDYNAGQITSISEELIKKQGSGAVGVLASTNESYAGSNDAFAKALINSLWPNPGIPATFRRVIDFKLVSNSEKPKPMDKIGYTVLQGHIQAKQTWGGGALSIYHYYGDPSMDMDFAPPTAISASMSDTADVKNGNYNIYWSNLTDGMVTLTVNNNVVSRSEITSGGTASLALPSGLIPAGASVQGTITITGKHCCPFTKNITITNK